MTMSGQANRALRALRPSRVDITIDRVHLVNQYQGVDLGYYTWDLIEEVRLGVTERFSWRVSTPVGDRSGRCRRLGRTGTLLNSPDEALTRKGKPWGQLRSCAY